VTTAQAPAQDQFLYGPHGERLTGTPTPAPAIQLPTGTGSWRAVTTQGTATVWEKTAPTPTSEPVPVPAPTQPAEAVVPARPAEPAPAEQAPAEPEEQRPTTNPAPPAPAAKEERGFFDRIGPWIALYAAIGLTASGEYALAHLVGFPGLIAALLPIAIDIYVIQAFRRHRDVAAALILMVATNALFHLADAHLFGVTPPNPETGATAYRATWWLIVAVSAIGPFIVWRVHRITETQPETVPVAVSEDPAATAPSGVAADCNATVSPVAAQPVSGPATPRETVRETVRETARATPRAPRETATATRHETAVAATETVPDQRETVRETARETARATRRETPRRTSTAKPVATTQAAIQLLPRAEQLAIVEGFVKRHTGDGDIPLQPIADALGCSKATASRRLAAYRDSA
jgi:hypothetical protein